VVKQAIAAKTSAPEVPVSEAQAAHTEPAVPAEVLRPLDEAQSMLIQLQAAAAVHDLPVKLERGREWTPRAEVAQVEVAAVRAERDGLRVRIEELQARIEEAECLAAEIREAHDELERLRGQLRREQAETAKLLEQSARAAEQLRAELREREGRLDEVTARRDETAREAQLVREALHECERLDELAAPLAEAEREVERTRAEAARRDLQGQFDQRRQALFDPIESARWEADAARQERDEARQRAEALERERDRLASRLDEQEQAHNEAEQSLRHEVEQLRRASEQARQDASAAASRAESLGRQVATHEDDLRRQRLEREQEGRVHQERFASLMNQLEATQADARRVAEPEPAELRSRLTQALSQSQAEKERADRLEAELQAAREQMALNHGLVLAQLYESSADQSKPAAVTAGDEELASARNRIEELDRQLQAAQQANQNLNSLLASLGVWDEGL
jgi:chromosome segregation ATPase